MKKSGFLSFGVIVSAVLASLCCLGPALLSIIGIAGIGAFSLFESYRPFLITLTLALLGVGFSLAYRKREVSCEDGTCKMESADRLNKIVLWVAAFFAFLFILFPYVPISFSQDQSSKASTVVQVTIPVKGMTCSGCNAHVESVVKKIDGVTQVNADFKVGEAVVRFDSSKITVAAIIDQISKTTGYKASTPEKNYPR